MPITPQEIENVVLEEDDFGHEMRVGSILSPKNIILPRGSYAQFTDPIHGATYTDPKTNKARQFDYRSQVSRGHMGKTRILFAVECKNLYPDLPLVVCGRPRTKEEAYHVFIGSDNNRNPGAYRVDGNSSIYKSGHFVGKSLLRLKLKSEKLCGDGDSEIYDRWSQALASSHELASGAIKAAVSGGIGSFVLPVVALPNKSLWQVSYNDDGKPIGLPEQTDKCEYYVDHKMPISLPFGHLQHTLPIVLTHILFVTVDGLKKTLADYANSDSYHWDEAFGPHTATKLIAN